MPKLSMKRTKSMKSLRGGIKRTKSKKSLRGGVKRTNSKKSLRGSVKRTKSRRVLLGGNNFMNSLYKRIISIVIIFRVYKVYNPQKINKI